MVKAEVSDYRVTGADLPLDPKWQPLKGLRNPGVGSLMDHPVS